MNPDDPISPLGQFFMHAGCACLHAWKAFVALLRSPFAQGLAFGAVILAWVLFITGCGTIARIKAGPVQVSGVKDGTPTTLATSTAGESVALPAGSSVVITERLAVPAQPATVNAPAMPAQPALVVTEIRPAAATEWRKTASTVTADTGGVDVSIAAKKVDAAEARPLLYAALACMAAAGFFVWASYPTPAIACAAAAAVFFMAWKMTGLPDWFWALGLLAAGVGAALYFGHERGEKSAASLNTNTTKAQ